MATLASVYNTAPVPPIAFALPTATTAASTSSSAESQKKELLQYIKRSINEDEEFHFLRFEKLQRTNLVALQMKLIRTKDVLSNATTVSCDDLEKLRVTLEQYGKYDPVASHKFSSNQYQLLQSKTTIPSGRERAWHQKMRTKENYCCNATSTLRSKIWEYSGPITPTST
ncbi:hypothetical protein IG631_09671 [Alternaria alternata]|nr:hypothetical protein IG631_09671 [Alternaria alternata]